MAIPCAAHVPPRCRRRTKSLSECKQGFPAAIQAVFNAICKCKLACIQKTSRNRHRKPQNRFPDRLRGLQNPPWSAPESHDAVQDQPEGAQERPKGGQDAPKSRPRAANRRPRAPKTHQRMPRRLPERSKIEVGKPPDQFSARSWWEAVCERLQDRFFVLFSACAQLACMWKT